MVAVLCLPILPACHCKIPPLPRVAVGPSSGQEAQAAGLLISHHECAKLLRQLADGQAEAALRLQWHHLPACSLHGRRGASEAI